MLERYTQRELTAISVIFIYSVPNRLRSQKISFQFILCIERYLAKHRNWDIWYFPYTNGYVERSSASIISCLPRCSFSFL